MKHLSTVRLFALAAGLNALPNATSDAQSIELKPPILVSSAPACANDPPPQVLSISNTGSGGLTWQIASTSPAGLTVSPTNGSAPSSVTVKPPAGLSVGVHRYTMTVTSNDPAAPSKPVEVIVVIWPCASGGAPGAPPPGALPAIYEVELSAIGYSGDINAAPNCKVNVNGYDRLVGTLSGYEPTAPNVDAVYAGTLRRDTNVDYCMTKGKSRPGDDERIYCVASLTGNDATDVELRVYGDADRGAYLKATSSPAGVSSKHVNSQCDAQEINDIKNEYPASDDGGGMSPNGQPIADVNAVDPSGRKITFYASGLARLRVGTYPPDKRANPYGGWTLRVIRKIR